MQSIAQIDCNLFKCVADNIVTNDVIITEERINHIKNRHPNDYENFHLYIREIIENPDYIVEANKPNTAILLKEIKHNNQKFKLVLRLAIQTDPTDYKNSIISFWHIGQATWEKTLKNKNILYKKE